MGEVLATPHEASCELVTEPARGKACVRCGKPLSEPTGHRWARAAAREDPFCSAACCRAYYGVDIATDAERRAEGVREGELRCSICHEWKPDDDYPRKSRDTRRRGRQDRCRECARRIRHGRGRAPAICQGCGGFCNPESLVCRGCYLKGVRGAPT